MYCIKCGATLPEDAAFCSKCGAPIEQALGKEELTDTPFEGAEETVNTEEAVNTEDAVNNESPEASDNQSTAENDNYFTPEESESPVIFQGEKLPPKKSKLARILKSVVATFLAAAILLIVVAIIATRDEISNEELEGEWVIETEINYLFTVALENMNETDDGRQLLSFFSKVDSNATVNLYYDFDDDGTGEYEVDEKNVRDAYSDFFDDLSVYAKEIGVERFAQESGLWSASEVKTMLKVYTEDQIVDLCVDAWKKQIPEMVKSMDLQEVKVAYEVDGDKLYLSENTADARKDGYIVIEYDSDKETITVIEAKAFDNGASIKGKKWVRENH